MAITTRAVKQAELTHAEMDENFTDLRDNPTGIVLPKTQGIGIKVDTAAPTFPWRSLQGAGFTDALAGVQPTIITYRNGIGEFNFAEGASMLVRFHIPHDYAMGTDIHLHVHWSHISTTVTGGSVTWSAEMTYAKGHGQAVFPATKTVSAAQDASLTAYNHQAAESVLTVAGGSGVNFDTADNEVGGMFLCRFYLNSNDIIDSVLKPDPFVHGVSLEYQTTNVGTKNKDPDFWA